MAALRWALADGVSELQPKIPLSLEVLMSLFMRKYDY